MAASMINTTKTDENLETYCTIWLDASVNNSKENLTAQQQLRTLINHLLTFEDDQQCLQHIHSLPNNDRVVLIVSGKLGRSIVPQTIQLRQIISIYVYCTDKKTNQQWAQHFSKVKGVVVRLDELIQKIQTDQIQWQHNKIDEKLSIDIFNSSGLNGQFIQSQLLIDCLIRMKSSTDERKELITLCKQQYKNNPAELEIIKEFERDYTSKRSLWWYTRETFVYRLLNKTLRVQNINILYLFRFLIRDLGEELEKDKCSSPIRVYRAQQMSKEEIGMLNKSVGEFISVNSFLSTNINRQQARGFLSHADPSLPTEPVFFEIDVNPRLNNIRPFSNITSFSYFHKEEEVLFMIGSIFRLVEIIRDDGGIWDVRMMLCSKNDHRLQSLFQHMKNKLGTGDTNLLRFGHVLRDGGTLDDAEKYYHRYLNQLSDDHSDISLCYEALGMVTDTNSGYNSSLKWYNKSLEIDMRTLTSDHSNIANTLNSIAIVHHRKGDYTHALQSYEKALIIRQKHLPADHPDLGTSLNNIDIIHRCLPEYDQALEHYNLSLKTHIKSLSSQHPNIAITLENIGNVYEDKGGFQQAFTSFNKAAQIFRHTLAQTHPNVIKIEQSIKHVSSKTK